MDINLNVISGAVIVGVLIIVGFLTCTRIKEKEPVNHKQYLEYVLFEMDSVNRVPATAWCTQVAFDTTKTMDDKIVHYRDTSYYVWWPITIIDSLRHAIKNKDGKDSSVMGWLYMRKDALIKHLGKPGDGGKL